jgi:hypothetical protein
MTTDHITEATGQGTAPTPATSVRLQIAGLRIALEFADGAGIAERIAELWGHVRDPDAPLPALSSAGTAGAEQSVPAPDIRLRYARSGTPTSGDVIALDDGDGATYRISTDLTRAVIGKLLGSRILLHAGAVEHPRHGVILLVGPSGAGKSTATTHLGRAGRYLTDELAIVDPHDFALTAYSKPVSRVDGGAQRGRKRDLSLASQGLDPISAAPAPSLVILLDRDRGESGTSEHEPVTGAPAGTAADAPRPASLRRVPLREALPRIIEQSSSLWAVPGGLAALAELLTVTGGAVSARYREAAELEALLGDLPAPESEPWEIIDPDPAPRAPEVGEVGVAPFVQALVLDDCIMVLDEGTAVLVEGLSAQIWDELNRSGPMTLDVLEAAITELLGPHPASRELVGVAVDQLVESSLLLRG